ncbi:MAG: 2-phospho-L-lactate guanylyltransferase [Acidimicrobiia bacterium]|nr:2-phospho-L-lactate guanylyltransferase [Acidimicrobiia bacterium]MDX2466672.1 2-phospho-L-lactate guanylyltransferase [Acidimicrobiia bacterium]
MSKAILAAIPIKPFGVAKRRLSSHLDAAARSRVGKAIAERTAEAATDAGALVAVVTGDAGVAQWARAHGYLTIDESVSTASGLDGAAEAAVLEATRRQRPWAVIHADLPLVTPAALHTVFAAAAHGPVLVPSYDGGTNVVAGTGSGFRFRYGEASFHRHLAANHAARIITNFQLALDLDTTADLARVLDLDSGGWLRKHVR